MSKHFNTHIVYCLLTTFMSKHFNTHIVYCLITKYRDNFYKTKFYFSAIHNYSHTKFLNTTKQFNPNLLCNIFWQKQYNAIYHKLQIKLFNRSIVVLLGFLDWLSAVVAAAMFTISGIHLFVNRSFCNINNNNINYK
jgi:hypothetical protein